MLCLRMRVTLYCFVTAQQKKTRRKRLTRIQMALPYIYKRPTLLQHFFPMDARHQTIFSFLVSTDKVHMWVQASFYRLPTGLAAYSPFHSSLPFEHLGQSNLFTRVCRLFVNQVTFYPILELKQCPRCQVFLKSIQHLSLGNAVTSSDKKTS